MKYIFTIFLLSVLTLNSKVYLENFNSNEYPFISADFYRFSNESLNQNLLFLFEQGEQSEIIRIDTLNKGNDKNINGYIVLDISNSMLNFDKDSKGILRSIISSLTKKDSLGFITYNQNSIVRTSKTNDTTTLVNSTSTINYFGSNNLNELFFNSPFSLNNICEENEDIIIITDKEGFADFDQIKSVINQKKINIHIIQLSNSISENLKDISNGYYLKSSQFNSDYKLLSFYLVSKIKNEEYLRLTWESKENSKFVSGNVVEAPNYSFEFKYENLKFEKLIDVNPSYIKVKEFEIGKELIFDINLKSNFSDIKINDIYSTNSEFKINHNINELKKDIVSNFKVTFTPQNNNFSFTKIYIELNNDMIEIPIEVGIYNSSNRNISLETINGKKHYRGDTVFFKIENKLPSDTLSLEYEIDNQWFIANENISTENFEFRLPNITPQTIDLRLSFKNNEYKPFDIRTITLWGSNPKLLRYSKDYEICSFIGEDNKLYAFGIDNPSSGGLIGSSLNNSSDLAISNNNENVAVANGKKIIIFDREGADQPIELKEQENNIVSLDFNYNDNALYSSDELGNIQIYNSFTDTSSPFKTIKLFNQSIVEINTNPNKDIISFYTFDGKLEISHFENQNLKRVFFKDFEKQIYNIEWSQNGDSLYVSTENENFIYLLTFIQSKYELVEISKKINSQSNLFTYGFESGLYFEKTNSLIKIYNKNLELLDSLTYNINRFNNLHGSYFAINNVNNTLQIYNLNLFKQSSYINPIIFSNIIEVIPKFLNFKDLNVGTICNEIPLDTLLNSYLYNSNDKHIILDSIKISNNTLNNIDISLESFIQSKSNYELNLTINPNELGSFESQVKVFSAYDSFDFDINYNVITDNITKSQTYFDLGEVLIGDSLITTLDLFSTLDNVKIEKIIFDNDDNFIEINLLDSSLSNDNIIFKISPQENKVYQESFRIYTENACTPFDFIVYGKGVQPRLKYLSEINNDTIFCPENNLESLKILNEGNGNLVIQKSISTNPSLSFSISSNTIKPNEELEIDFDINTLSNGNYNDTLIFTIKGKINNSNEIRIPLNYSIYYSNLVAEELVDLGTHILNEDKSSTFNIVNNGEINEFISIKSINGENFFEIIDNNQTILKNNLRKFNIRFKGGDENIVYEELFTIDGKCNNSNTFLARIDLRDNEPTLQTIKTIQFPDIYCSNNVIDTSLIIDTTLIIINTGKKDLIIDNILFEDENNVFSLTNWNNSRTLSSEESFELNIRFTPNDFKSYQSKLILFSNSNINNGIDSVLIIANIFNTDLEFENNELSYLNIESNSTLIDTITIFNFGNISEELEISNTNPKLSFEFISNNKLEIDESIRLELNFQGGIPDEIVYDTLFIEAYCRTYSISIEIIIKGTNYFELSTEKIVSKTGDIINIPIFFNNPKNLNLLSFPIRIKSELLVNKNIVSFSSSESYIEENLRVLPLEFEINNLNFQNVLNIEGRITLGDIDSSIISFRNTEIIGDDKYYFEFKNGLVKIDNICIEGGYRFIEGSSSFQLNPIYPNPSNAIIYISYSLLEDAQTQLYITDINGNIIEFLIDNKVFSHSNTLTYNIEKLTPGVYFVNLLTKNNKITRSFQVVR